MSQQDALARLLTGYWKSLVLPMLAEFAFAVGQGGQPTKGRRCYRFSYQSSSGSDINGKPYTISLGTMGQVVSLRDVFHAICDYRAPPPAR